MVCTIFLGLALSNLKHGEWAFRCHEEWHHYQLHPLCPKLKYAGYERDGALPIENPHFVL